jgi:hypothetical protein
MSVHPIQQKSAVHILFFSYASIPGRVKNPENSDYVAIDTMDDNVEHIWHGQKPRVVRRGTTGMRKANQSIDRSMAVRIRCTVRSAASGLSWAT